MEARKKLELGEFYKELRIARGFKQKDVARNHLSVSQLSKFENGQSMLSADKMLIAISGINMTFAEFGHALNHYETTEFYKKGYQIVDLFHHHDIEGLKRLLNTQESSDICTFLNKIVIKNYLRSLDSSYEISEVEKKKVTEYLYSIEAWTEYELYIFGNTTSWLSTEDLIFLEKDLLTKAEVYGQLSENRRKLKQILLNLISEMIDRDEYSFADYFIEKLGELLIFQDIFEKIILKFLQLALQVKQKEIPFKNLETYIESLKMLEVPELINILENKIDKYQ